MNIIDTEPEEDCLSEVLLGIVSMYLESISKEKRLEWLEVIADPYCLNCADRLEEEGELFCNNPECNSEKAEDE